MNFYKRFLQKIIGKAKIFNLADDEFMHIVVVIFPNFCDGHIISNYSLCKYSFRSCNFHNYNFGIRSFDFLNFSLYKIFGFIQ